MTFAYKLLRSLVVASLGFALGGCLSSATAVVVAVDTDIPPDRPMTVNVRVQRSQGSVGTSVQWVRGQNRVEFPLSFSVSPLLVAHRGQPVQIDFAVELPARSAVEPTIRFNRRVSFTYTPNRTGILRVFLPLRCGESAVGCPQGEAAQCTVARLCEIAGLTCGNSGECVGIESPVSDFDRDAEFVGADVASDSPTRDVPNDVNRDSALLDTVDAAAEFDVPADGGSMMDVDVPALLDAGADASFDVPPSDVPSSDVPSSDVPNSDVPNSDVPNRDVPNNDVADTCVRNCAGRNCGPDGCGGVCGPACSALANAVGVCSMMGTCGIQCNANFGDCDGNIANGCEANLQTDRNHCGTCPVVCAAAQNCNSGRCMMPACMAPQVSCGGVCYTFGAACGAGMCPGISGVTPECQAGLPSCGLRCDAGVIVCGTVGVEGRACELGLGVCRQNGQCGCGVNPNTCIACGMCQACGQGC